MCWTCVLAHTSAVLLLLLQHAGPGTCGSGVPAFPHQRGLPLARPHPRLTCALHAPTAAPQVRDNIAVHIPCSSKKMGIEESFMKVRARSGRGGMGRGLATRSMQCGWWVLRMRSCLSSAAVPLAWPSSALTCRTHKPCGSHLLPPQVASMCAGNVVNTNVPCCGMAGDRGMRYPELTAASLQVGRLGCMGLWGWLLLALRGAHHRLAAGGDVGLGWLGLAAGGGRASWLPPSFRWPHRPVRTPSHRPCCMRASRHQVPPHPTPPHSTPPHPTSPHLPPQHLNVGGCSDGYSTSRTCEMSLSNHSGINFRG